MIVFRTPATPQPREANPLAGLLSSTAVVAIRNALSAADTLQNKEAKISTIRPIIAADLDHADQSVDGQIPKEVLLAKFDTFLNDYINDSQTIETLDTCIKDIGRTESTMIPSDKIAECIAPVVYRAVSQQIDEIRKR